MAKFKKTYARQEYEDAVRSAFRLGMRERQMNLEKRMKVLEKGMKAMSGETGDRRIAVMQTGMQYLAAEVARLDQDEHLDGLIVPLRLLDTIRRALDGRVKTETAQYTKRQYCKKALEKHMQSVGGSIDELVRKVEDAK